MPSLNELARTRADLTDHDVEWLHLLLADWQLLADLSFADLILWLPLRDGSGFIAAAQMRPTTGPTVYHDDVVGRELARGRRRHVDAAFDERRICADRELDFGQDVTVREETIPVVRDGVALAVVSRHTNLAAARMPSRLELTYLRTADDLSRMMSQGRFPIIGTLDQVERAPRVGDGLIRLGEQGHVTFASPNALSAFRRLGLTGDLLGRHLGVVAGQLARLNTPLDETLPSALGGTSPRQLEVEADGVAVRFRVIPLVDGAVHVAALVLCRDVTEVRRRERELVSKDVTIREIHHRVKNNLQTVAALLRLQSRRLESVPARQALEEAQRRVASIAVVHEILARTLDEAVDFDEIADRVSSMVTDDRGDAPHVRVTRSGRFGTLAPEVATALSLVLVEVLQNAVEHGLGEVGGTIDVAVHRGEEELELVVTDDGVGLPPDFDADRLEPGDGTAAPRQGLGLHIVRTLVETELGGGISLSSGLVSDHVGASGPGCAVRVHFPVAK